MATLSNGTTNVNPDQACVMAALDGVIRYNLCSLVELRAACPMLTRQAFDAAVNGLRRAGVLFAANAEGRSRLTPAEVAAAIPEHGDLILFVGRRMP